jgi:hypothetical protein
VIYFFSFAKKNLHKNLIVEVFICALSIKLFLSALLHKNLSCVITIVLVCYKQHSTHVYGKYECVFLVCGRKYQFLKNDCVKILLQKERHVFLNYDTCYTKNIKIIENNKFLIYLYIYIYLELIKIYL